MAYSLLIFSLFFLIIALIGYAFSVHAKIKDSAKLYFRILVFSVGLWFFAAFPHIAGFYPQGKDIVEIFGGLGAFQTLFLFMALFVVIMLIIYFKIRPVKFESIKRFGWGISRGNWVFLAAFWIIMIISDIHALIFVVANQYYTFSQYLPLFIVNLMSTIIFGFFILYLFKLYQKFIYMAK
jgi:hypothetical protein